MKLYNNKISICSIHSGQNIQDNFYIKINKKTVHVQNISLNRILYILDCAVNGNLNFISRNFQIKEAPNTYRPCMFCDSRKHNYYIYGNPNENKFFIVCDDHLKKLSIYLNDIVQHGNCFLVSTKEFEE